MPTRLRPYLLNTLRPKAFLPDGDSGKHSFHHATHFRFVPCRALDDAIAAIRARPKPLALYVFAERPAAIERILASDAPDVRRRPEGVRPENPVEPSDNRSERSSG